MTLLLVLACVSIVTALQGNRDSGMDEAAIEKAVLKVNDEMIQASNNLDADKFFEYILDTNKGLIIQDGILFKTHQEAYDVVKKGFEAFSKLQRSFNQIYVTVISSNTALLTGTGTTRATLKDGQTITAPFAVSLVFVLKDGQWKLLQGHYSTPNP
jgi:ketosteroid isomerase-like protein